jgi:hypothetical protein
VLYSLICPCAFPLTLLLVLSLCVGCCRCRMSFPEVGENAFSLELTYNYGQSAAAAAAV